MYAVDGKDESWGQSDSSSKNTRQTQRSYALQIHAQPRLNERQTKPMETKR